MNNNLSFSGVIPSSQRVAPSNAACRWTSLSHSGKSGILLFFPRLRFLSARRLLSILISEIRAISGCFFDQTNPKALPLLRASTPEGGGGRLSLWQKVDQLGTVLDNFGVLLEQFGAFLDIFGVITAHVGSINISKKHIIAVKNAENDIFPHHISVYRFHALANAVKLRS